MRKEISAGGIVFKKVPANGKKSSLHWLLCQHSQHKGWVFPKGLIGDIHENETKEDTAVREVKEETGADAKIIKQLPTDVRYWYQFKGEKVAKTVFFYLMEYLGGDITKHDHEMMDVKWVPTDQVKHVLTYENDKKAFDQAVALYNLLYQINEL